MYKILTGVALFSALSISTAFTQPDEERSFLLLYFKEEELVVVSPSRSPKPVSQVAENVTVITASDIELMNAHTPADVLNSITGVQVLMTGGPGSVSQASIQGFNSRHVSVFMDGIPLNNLSNNVSDVASFPVQYVEKIEIIKGPASSAWGSALGGVINIITKSASDQAPKTTTSLSYGKRNTGDIRAETSGRQGGFGYYVNAGRLQTDGFKPHNDFSGKNTYAKLSYDLSKNTSALFTVGYDNLSRGEFEDLSRNMYRNDKFERLSTAVSMNSTLNEQTSINLSLWRLHQTYDFFYFQLTSGSQLMQQNFEDSGYGSTAKLFWKNALHNVVTGVDSDTRTMESNTLTSGEQKLTKSAFFINDTMSFGRLSATPGIRRDHTNSNGDFTSPSFGITYKLADSTVLRAYSARGFNIPPLSATNANPDLKMEKVSSYEVGAETAASKYFWLKFSGFRHEIRDAITGALPVNSEKQRRQGMEIELKTAPAYHTSLSAGAAFINTKDLNTGGTVPNVPQRTYDLGLQYDDEKALKVLLKGHYIYWNSDPFFMGKYNAFITDLHVMNDFYTHDDQVLAIFVDIHNIFNGSQYFAEAYQNPERWVEAGIRYTF